MLVAAFFRVVVGALAPEWLPGLPLWLYPWLGILADSAVSLILAWLIAFFHLELGLAIPNQYVEMIPPFVTIAALVLYNIRRKAQIAANARRFEERMAAEHGLV